MPAKLPEFLTQKYGTSTIEDLRKAKQELTEVKNRELYEAVEVKGYSASDIKPLLKEIGVEYLEGYEERVVQFTISTEDVDRDSDVVIQEGLDIADYMKNPIILFAHNGTNTPIGATLKITKYKYKTKALALFFDDRVDKSGLSDTIYTMVKAGAIRGASIGFGVKDGYFPDEKEMKERGMDPWGIVFSKTFLLEWSVVSVPANQNALRESKGMFTDKHLQKMVEYGFAKQKDVESINNDVDSKQIFEICYNISEGIKTLAAQITDLQSQVKELKTVTIPKGLEQTDNTFDDLTSKIDDVLNTFKKN